MKARFTLHWIEEVITDESAANGEAASSKMDEGESVDLREAIDALRNGCWDNVDVRPAELIAYPADWRMDMRTGDYEASTLVIKGSPKDIGRLVDCYEPFTRPDHRSSGF